METLVLPLGDTQEAQVDIKFGAGHLVTRKATPGSLVEGTFQGGVKHRLDGAGRVELRQDLGDLRLRTLELHTGASDTLVRLPRAAGSTTVRAESGAAALTIEVPFGVAARIRLRMALGSSRVDETRFPRIGDLYQSADYGTSSNRVDIDVQGGIGSVKVVGGAPQAAGLETVTSG